MKIKTNGLTSNLNKVSYFQLFILILISFIYFMTYKDPLGFSGLIIGGTASFLYTQLIKLGSYSKIFALFGFPIRLVIVGVPLAILVHKSHSNLIALFIGFAICQFIYIIFMWQYAKKDTR